MPVRLGVKDRVHLRIDTQAFGSWWAYIQRLGRRRIALVWSPPRACSQVVRSGASKRGGALPLRFLML